MRGPSRSASGKHLDFAPVVIRAVGTHGAAGTLHAITRHLTREGYVHWRREQTARHDARAISGSSVLAALVVNHDTAECHRQLNATLDRQRGG